VSTASPTSLALPAAPAPSPPRRSRVEQVMGIPVSVLLRGPGARDDASSLAVDRMYAELRRLDALFSTYREQSEIRRLDRGELDLADCSPEVRDVLDLCAQATAQTDGLFDAYLPTEDGAVRLDPSGLVKSWAVEHAARFLPEDPGMDFCVNAGGDVLARCAPGRTPWRVGIENPRDRSRILAVAEVSNGAVATSGTAARGLHLVDPRSGLRPDGLGSVTVRGPSLMVADVWATAGFVRGAEALSWLARQAGYAALVVDLGGTVTATDDW
jgi:thiamine biosynthesis lipoprotein